MPITLESSSEVVFLDEAVTIQGRAGGTEGAQVTLVVEPPAELAQSLQAETLNAKIDAEGNFTQTFTGTKAPGRYTVTATAPDGKGKARSQFDVYFEAAEGDLSKDDAAEQLKKVTGQLAETLTAKIESLPPSPQKEALAIELKKATDALAQIKSFPPLPKLIADGQIASKLLDDAGRKRYRDGRRKLMQGLAGARELSKSSAQKLNAINAEPTTCDTLEVVKEGLQLISFMLNFAETAVFDVVIGFGKEIAGLAATNNAKQAGASDIDAFTLSEGVKEIDSIYNRQLDVKTGHSVAYDVLGFVADQVMDSYCQVFSGPIEGTMSAEFRAENGEVWWTYSFKITGRITFHHAKSATGDRVGVRGRIEGYAHTFTTWEDALGVDGPKGTLVAAKIIFPPFDAGAKLATTLAGYDEGSVAGAALPNSFFIPIDGELAYDDKSLNLRLGQASTDIDVSSRVVNIAVSPFALSPMPVIYLLPFKDARFLMQRAFQGEIVQLPLTIEGKTMSLRKVFTYQGGGERASGSYSVTIEAKSSTAR